MAKLANPTLSALALKEQLVQHIYGFLNEATPWQEAAFTLDALLNAQQSNHQSTPEAVASLLPHLSRVNLLLSEIQKLRINQHQSNIVLEQIPMGITLLEPHGDIIQINGRARAEFDRIGAKHQDCVLKFNDPAHQKILNDALAKAHHHSEGVYFKIEDVNLWIARHDNQSKKLFVLYCSHIETAENINILALQKLYSLTGKEAQVASELCRGQSSLDEVALTLRINKSTVRSHLKQVFIKTDTRRQTQLIKTILTNPTLVLNHPSTHPPLEQTEPKLLKLFSGRTVSYAEYGCPNGKPVLMCHPVSDNRNATPPNYSVLNKHRIRLIVPDRPGHGSSSPSNNQPMDDWLNDMRLFLPQLGIKKCSVLACADGGAFAMQLAVALPELIKSLYLVSCSVPPHEQSTQPSGLPLNRMIVRLAQTNEPIARAFIRVAFKTSMHNPEKHFLQTLPDLPPSDRAMIENSQFHAYLSNSFKEMSKQEVDAATDELIFISRDWQLNTNQIHCPVSIWHGEDDAHFPIGNMKQLTQRFNAPIKTNWVKNSGHFLIYSHWKQIIADMATS